MEKKEKVKKVRKMFLDELPRYKNGSHIGDTNWSESARCKVKFDYDGTKGEVEIIDYKSPYLYIKYLDKEPYKIDTCSFKKCNLGKLLGIITNEFKVKIGTHFKDEKRDLIVTDMECKPEYYVGEHIWNKKYYKYTCNKCGWTEGWIEESSLLAKHRGCSCCAGMTVVEGINDIPTTAPWMVKFFQGGYDEAKLYTKSSTSKIFSICPDCGRIKDKEVTISWIYSNKSIGCPKCSDGQSYPNKFMFNVLEQLNINFQPEYSPNWIGKRRYDFYIPNLNIIIEVHGEQHYEETGRKSARKLEEEQENDRIKKELSIKNGIKEENYIVIDCRKSELDFIKNNILKSKLNNIFNLNNIDWNKCETFALSNRVKEACELKKNNPDLTTSNISRIMKIGAKTASIYLKQGAKLCWCEYDPDEERRKSALQAGKTRNKQVEIFKNNISLGVFESAHELDRQSEEIFGVKLQNANISMVANGKRKSHKGFIFKYV